MSQPSLQPNKKFVYFLRGFSVKDKHVRENEIGIVEKTDGEKLIVLVVRIDIKVVVPQNMVGFFDPLAVGDAFPKKVCNVCQRYLDTGNFQLNQNGKGDRPIRRPSCNDCREVIDGVSVSSADRKKWERTRPNLVPFSCPICGKTTIPGLTSKVVLDHNHIDGSVRGWICDSCNTGIGRFKDDVELLKKAIRYLENQGKG